MNSTTRVNPETGTGVDFDAIIRDVAALRQDFADLMSQMKSGAFKGAKGAAEHAWASSATRPIISMTTCPLKGNGPSKRSAAKSRRDPS